MICHPLDHCIGAAVFRRRLDSGHSLGALAMMMGCDTDWLAAVEAGQVRLTSRDILVLADGLQIHPSALMRGECDAAGDQTVRVNALEAICH